ncbi:DUF4157 domain-containing protein [Duganella sp. sic0402]|uniref:eCIS core domain-containing protein n=1 Tax=Duganella sp. sic0402 TaxID=2854786 RepID=UPI001C47474C|nr:DUF4157 domain-containing protein [Duganella sp. sic0402]MBV7534706.1 DUF4157 domain-containing protein [Duganella sp. sic0402]
MSDYAHHQRAPSNTAAKHPQAGSGSKAGSPALQRYALQANSSPQALQLRQQAQMAQAHSRNGLPHQLKANLEALSGFDMSDVRVHRNSAKPAQLHAHAYAQGSDIHLAPGQEKHLAHEAWHVVQQKQGRVKPTVQMKTELAINDDAGLEREADLMGDLASHEQAPGKHAPIQQSVPSNLMQLKWISDGRSGVLLWDRQLDGLRWFYRPDTGMLYYEIEDNTNLAEPVRAEEGIAHSRAEWLNLGLGFESGDWSASDTEIVPFVPSPDENIKLGNSKREMTRRSLELQAGKFINSTSSGATTETYEEFVRISTPIIEQALVELQSPEKIPEKVVTRLVESFILLSDENMKTAEGVTSRFNTPVDGEKRSEQQLSRAKSEALITTFKQDALLYINNVATDKLRTLLGLVLKRHGPENQFDALTAANNLLKRFVGNTKITKLNMVIELHNMLAARLRALDFRTISPITVTTSAPNVKTFIRQAPVLTLNSTIMELERSYDVLSRRTGAVTDTGIIHVHEVDLAFVRIFKGITEAYANPASEMGDELTFGGGGGVGEKVFAADYLGSTNFRSDTKKREERFYGLIFPKGYIETFGMDIRDKSKYGAVGKTGSVREPNELEFSRHLMPKMNGDPEVAIDVSKLFFLRAETSTPKGQVDIHFGWRDMRINDQPMHHPDFFRQYVLGVIEFSKKGRIIRYQPL